MYTIGQVAKMFDLPISTLRFYDKEGLFPNLERVSGIRKFSDDELEKIRVIECLKQSGLEIKEIKYFIELCSLGSDSYTQRKALFEERRQVVENEMIRIQRTLAMLQYKCWYYEQAINYGNEDNIHAMLPDHLPENIQSLYDYAHSK
jgi:DNA-binding transcriptional MerR regulator